MQQVARYHDYNQQHQNTRTHAAGSSSLYEAPSPVQSVESPPGSEAAGTANNANNSTSSYQQHYRQQQQQLRKGSAVVVSSAASQGMNLQPSPVSLQQSSSAVDYSNGATTANNGSNGRLDVVGNVENNSCSQSSYMPAYCLAPPSHTVTSVSDVYQQQNVYQNQQLIDVDSSNLKLRMQQDSGSSTGTTVTTPEVISMLKNPDFDGAISTSTTAGNMLYDNDKVLDQVGIMRDLVKPVTCSSSDPMKQNFNMDAAHCSSVNPASVAGQVFPQHLGSLQKDYFSIHDQQERVGGATVHHMGHPDLHYPALQMPGTLQHNQMIVPVKSEPPQGMMGGSPPVSPIDMDHQEAIKSERKRMRNRIAAHKCRRRKLERISKLEDKVATLKNHNQELNNNINMLKQQVTDLKAKVLDHVNQGCEIIIDQRQLIM